MSESHTTTSGRGLVLPPGFYLAAHPPDTKTLALTIAGAAVAGAVVWHFSRETYYSYVPPKYQYRPGMFTGWVASLLARHAKRRRSRRPIRVYMDGCFDLMHYGHANALRQAKALGDELVVGLVPDREILRCKGPPILNDEERLKLVNSVKWVDEVLTEVPYDLTPDFLHDLFTKHKIDYVLHGDDPCLLPDGTDAYEHAKKLGRFKMIKRTEGVSTTDIVGRMLMCSRDNARFSAADKERLTLEFSMGMGDTDSESSGAEEEGDVPEGQPRTPRRSTSVSRHVTVSRFMPTSRRIVQFSSGKSAPPGARIVYIDGAFDLFHVGHVEILKKAKQAGDFLLVGVHSDEDVCERRGPHLPIMELHERALSVLSCRYVDEVVIGAPMAITEDLLTTFNISLVVSGTVHETRSRDSEQKRYAVPQEQGIFRRLESPDAMTSAKLIERIMANRAQFEARQARKEKSESAYYKTSKQYMQEI